MTEKTESAATMAEEGLAVTCEGIVRDYLAHRGYEVHVADGWSCDGEDAPVVVIISEEKHRRLQHVHRRCLRCEHRPVSGGAPTTP